MPCSGPSIDEVRQAEIAAKPFRLLAYVLAQTGKSDAREIQQLLATADSICAFDIYRYITFDEATSRLCLAIEGFSPLQQNTILWDGSVKLSRDLAEWWEKHQRLDRRRRDEEIERKAREVAQVAYDEVFNREMQR